MATIESEVRAMISKYIKSQPSGKKQREAIAAVASALQVNIDQMSPKVLPTKSGLEYLMRIVMHVADGQSDPVYILNKLDQGANRLLDALSRKSRAFRRALKKCEMPTIGIRT